MLLVASFQPVKPIRLHSCDSWAAFHFLCLLVFFVAIPICVNSRSFAVKI
jgi:hypothetical protein